MKAGFNSTGAKAFASRAAVAAFALLASLSAFAQSAAEPSSPHPWQLNMREGVTHSSRMAYEAHMVALWICVIIGLVVFGAMFYAMFKFRKSKGAVPDTSFTHSTKLEIVWTLVPVILLVGMAWPATAKLIAMYDTRNSEMTIKVTGYQWMWKYEYLGENVEFTSRLAKSSDAMRQSKQVPSWTNEADRNYLLDVDNVLVVPVNTKIRFVITADDVIHAWWVPSLGWKQDAIPGIINEAWTDIDTPGIYRGQCAELCGKDHGFMPIVVKAVSKVEYQRWLAEQKAKNPANASPAAAQATAVDAIQASPQGIAPRQPATPDPSNTPTPEKAEPVTH
ncbi:Cytochrome c oxidase polypeptide II [Lysobacter dokdonensis DS-58]|uniref:Cytochrome c oxidase subunit 2 n=1 Tax=Lysobacter dokdonensis DS-58 TaxID=1300345 RepID=A0A0A2WDM5_9GAMM|nr:cytochrome c oxidase subunit II [Lysobacter dokdonensis]KGQ18311.1 Cytochrome c oxidase polypeptide II [Lysobacter dokdonensis DS-58]